MGDEKAEPTAELNSASDETSETVKENTDGGLMDSVLGSMPIPTGWGFGKISDMAGAALSEVGEKLTEVTDGIVEKIETMGEATSDTAGAETETVERAADQDQNDSEIGQVWNQVKGDLDKATHWATDMIKEAIDVVADAVEGDEPQHTIGEEEEEDDSPAPTSMEQEPVSESQADT